MKGDLILRSTALYTGLSDRPQPGSVIIQGNQIIAVLGEEPWEAYRGDKTQVFDFGDRLIMPGISDAHMHSFVGAAVSSAYICTELFESTSEEECVRMLQDFREKHPDLTRIGGMGWFPANWAEGQLPGKQSLDRNFPDIPVYLLAADGHTFWLNTKALEEGGYTRPPRSEILGVERAEDGELTGLLFEIEACTYANNKAFELPPDKFKDAQQGFYQQLSSHGITSISDMSTNPLLEGDLIAYQVAAALEREGNLPVRINLYPSLGLDGNLEQAKALRSQYCSEKLRIAGLKQFLDGVTSTRTAALLEPYADAPEHKGQFSYPLEVYKKTVLAANRAGFAVRLHAIGDAAVRAALDTYEMCRREVPEFTKRNTVEHIETIHEADLERFAALNVVASMQPMHLEMDLNEKIERLGIERCRYEWPFRSLLERAACLAFGTDFPVAELNPFLGIYAAVTRQTLSGESTGINHEEKISLSMALKAYTYGSACSHNVEHLLGTIEPGKLADITVVNKNLFAINSAEIKECHAVMTIVDGQIVYEKR